MSLTANEYFALRSQIANNYNDTILAAEQKYMEILTEVTLKAVPNIYKDFSLATDLKPFWIAAAPEQRGYKPKGDSIPWGEVGEKTILATMAAAISKKFPDIIYPGLPFGSDLRFATQDALIHFDIKLTGPNDDPDEIVASPNQISGDGNNWDSEKEAVFNSAESIQYRSKVPMPFQPELPPFYILNGKPLLCLTYFLKAVYIVEDLGVQPLRYLEVVSVPNGLLLFDTLDYNSNFFGLLRPGKDEKEKRKKRARVKLNPLAQLAAWRCLKIELTNGLWQTKLRYNPSENS